MQNDITIPWWVKLILGLCFGACAALGIGVDLMNAYLYGMTVAPTLAALAALVAVLVVLIPIGVQLGAPRVLWGLQLACVATTMWCAWSYYGVRQAASSTVSAAAHERYSSAAENKRLAHGVLKTIDPKLGDTDELIKLANHADGIGAEAAATAKKNCGKRDWTDSCQSAKVDKTKADAASVSAHEHLSQAKTRDAALATLAKAEEKQEAGDAVVQEADTAFLIWAIFLVQGIASLGGVSARMIAEALASRPPRSRRQKMATVNTDGGGTRRELPSNVFPLTARRSVDAWLGQCTKSTAGGEVRGSEILRAYRRWGEADANITASTMRALLTSILGEGRITARTSGYAVLGLTLRSSQVQAKKAAAR